MNAANERDQKRRSFVAYCWMLQNKEEKVSSTGEKNVPDTCWWWYYPLHLSVVSCCGLLANIHVGQKDNTTEFCHIYTLQARIIMSTQVYAEALKSNSFCSGNFWQLCLMYFDVLPPDTVDSITPDKVRGLRDMLNSSAMDIMYYTSPLYRDEVSEKAPPFQHSV